MKKGVFSRAFGRRVRNALRRFSRDARGATAIEYGLMAALASGAATAAAPVVNQKIANVSSNVSAGFAFDERGGARRLKDEFEKTAPVEKLAAQEQAVAAAAAKPARRRWWW